MHELYELKEMLMDELEEYGRKGELTSGSLEVVDKLSHTIKNLCKIIEKYEDEEYSMADGGMSYEGGSYRDGRSYARRGGQSRRSSYARSRNSYARRDGRGRYSRDGAENMVMELRELMEDAPDEKTRMEFEKFIKKVENM